MPSEADRFTRLYQEHPSIANDPMVAFPIKVFKCFGQAGDNSHDLIVMPKANGQPLGDVLARKQSCGEMRDIMQILRQLGMFLARFHKSYNNKQHGDFSPSNVFYDVSSGAFVMIDIADLGNHTTAEGDIAHFCQSLKILSNSYGQQFYIDGKRNFEEGYRGMP
jgi:tRNA A-37 threonylcarbamoyl transferase component Bud32